MDTPRTRWAKPALKAALALAILAAVAWQFSRDLSRPELQELTLRPAWLVLAGGLYLAALGLSAWYWHHLLHAFGERPTLLAAARAYLPR